MVKAFTKKAWLTGFAAAVTGSMFLLSGCGLELLATTAIRGELEATQAKSATRQLEHVKSTVGTINMEQAIQAYRAENGANPPSLDALVPKYLSAVPRKPDGGAYHYDPLTGVVSSAPGPNADAQTEERIRAAITQYGTATGYYPPTLDALYPQYLPFPPRTAAGEAFIYNNQNGYLSHPRQQSAPVAQGPASRPASSVGGAGPMGEVMTGVGIQQELGRMSTGGASAAQSRTRSGAQDISGGHTNQQNRVMDQLGL